MADTNRTPLRVALIGVETDVRAQLRALLEKRGLQVVIEEGLHDWTTSQIKAAQADVLLVDLDDAVEADLERLHMLISEAPAPILFNVGGGPLDDASSRSLISKLARLAGRRRSDTQARGAPVAREDKNGTRPRPNLRVVVQNGDSAVLRAERVWVLAGSVGAPRAVQDFLGALPADVPAAFILAQHISGNFVSMLARQLNRSVPFPVQVAEEGLMLAEGQVLVVPAGHRLTVTAEGAVQMLPERRHTGYSPSIDSVMSEVAQRYGANAGAIVFSGMGDDGARGCREIVEYGGVVWAQDQASSVMSTMPDAARRQEVVSVNAAPVEMAKRLVEFLRHPP